MNEKQTDSEPVVSVLVLTYNHAPYIRECLDSVLLQKTDFPFEICIGEDGSEDGTREICREYAERYPAMIKLVLHSRSAPGRAEYAAQGNYNYVETLKQCRGKYIADLDGDDFWKDTRKLQKQYEILESDPSVMLVHSDYDIVDRNSNMRMQGCYAMLDCPHVVKESARDFLSDVLTNAYPIRTCTVVMRASAIREALAVCGEDLKQVPMADVPMWCEVLRLGKVAYQPESTAAYRSLEESACNSEKPLVKARFVNQAAEWGLLFGPRCGLPMKPILEHKIKTCNRYALMSGDYAEMRRLYVEHAGTFPPVEKAIYLVSRILPLRMILRALYIHTYRKTQKNRICTYTRTMP